VLFAHFHPLAGNSPLGLFEVEFQPLRPSQFTRPDKHEGFNRCVPFKTFIAAQPLSAAYRFP
jgi:hypothetical protein